MWCAPSSNGCAGATNSWCHANNVWSGSVQSGSTYYDRNLNSGSFNLNQNASTLAFSVRCTLVLDFSTSPSCLFSAYLPNFRIRISLYAGNCYEFYTNLSPVTRGQSKIIHGLVLCHTVVRYRGSKVKYFKRHGCFSCAVLPHRLCRL